MKRKYLVYAATLPVFTLGFAGAASAHGWFGAVSPEELANRHTAMFEEQANLLGASIDEVKNAWADGKTLFELAEEKGITKDQLRAKLEELKKEKLKSQLQALVQSGVITQAQADRRLGALEKFEGKKGFRGAGMMGMFRRH